MPLRLIEGFGMLVLVALFFINVCSLVVIAPSIVHYMSRTAIDLKQPLLAGVIKGLDFALYTIGLI